jgi:hypothetical protein
MVRFMLRKVCHFPGSQRLKAHREQRLTHYAGEYASGGAGCWQLTSPLATLIQCIAALRYKEKTQAAYISLTSTYTAVL